MEEPIYYKCGEGRDLGQIWFCDECEKKGFETSLFLEILNLGCGGEDYGTERVDFVKTKTTTKVINLDEKLPYPDGFFDEVYCKSALEHIGNVKQFISEALRVLKKGGEFWFRTDNASYLPFLFKDHQSYIEGTYEHHTEEDRHLYLFKEEHLKNIFHEIKDYKISFSCPSKKLFFLPAKFKCMHIEIEGVKNL